MRRSIALAAVLAAALTVQNAGAGGTAATPPAPAACTDGPDAIHAAPPASPGASVETNGTANDDTIFGTDATDVIRPMAGADCVDGGAGADELFDGERGNPEPDRVNGGPGNDTITLINGADAVLAGAGDDAIASNNMYTDVVDCGEGTDRVAADYGDRLVGCESEPLANSVRRVSPRTGRRSTRFLVRFRRPLVNDESNENYFSISVTPPEGSSCRRAGWESTQIRLGKRIPSVRLRGPARRGRWCRGLWTGELFEHYVNASSSCDSGDADPLACSANTRIGAFRFRVR